MPKDRRTITSIENGANGKTGKKLGIPSQVETANIPGFQSLEIVSLEYALPDALKTYARLTHHHKY